MRVDPNSAVPVYQQIADHIRRAIAAGVYRAGEMIPSLRALALELHVNPNTVKRAFETLERDGVIYARKGLGMFVTARGVRAAQSKSEAAVYDAFAGGVQAGLDADMSDEHIRDTFERAATDVRRKTRSGR